ncbi:MAG: FAD:protein FMN transferase [Oscillospiraceae bacterium]|nr:FAD:protein FMN transferase [Oscillospiraceae bacterium]
MIKISVLLIIFTVAISGCENMQAGEQVSETRLLLDTFCTITIHGAADDIDKLTDVMGRAFDICLEYEKLFSITIEGSDVWQINHAGGEPAAVSSQTIEVMRAGIEFGELSGGMFDITLGRLSRLWDFGGNKSVPDKAEIDAAQATVNYRQVNINGNFVHLENPDAWIDLGAIAKGYIADKIALYLAEQGVTSALIDLGGDIVTIGSRGDDKPWRLGIRAPFGSADEYIGVIEIVGASVVSSGIYERGFDESGVWYHHILDPGTGMPVISDIVSATVVADNAIIGEGLSTIVILAGSREAAALFERVPGFIGAVLVLENGEVQIFGDVRFAG